MRAAPRSYYSKPPTRMEFTTGLPYDELTEAKRLAHKGADYSLLYFWYNLLKRHYPEGDIEIVHADSRYFKDRNPEFAKEIDEWVTRYKKSIIHKKP